MPPLNERSVFTIGLSDEHIECLIEKSMNGEIGSALSEAEALLSKRFDEMTLAKLATL